jgi:hypothetical protein
MFDASPEREELLGPCREQEGNARAQGDDDDVIETPRGVAEEGSNCGPEFMKQRNTS